MWECEGASEGIFVRGGGLWWLSLALRGGLTRAVVLTGHLIHNSSISQKGWIALLSQGGNACFSSWILRSSGPEITLFPPMSSVEHRETMSNIHYLISYWFILCYFILVVLLSIQSQSKDLPKVSMGVGSLCKDKENPAILLFTACCLWLPSHLHYYLIGHFRWCVVWCLHTCKMPAAVLLGCMHLGSSSVSW